MYSWFSWLSDLNQLNHGCNVRQQRKCTIFFEGIQPTDTRGTGSNQQMVVQDNERNERSAWQLISFGVMKCHSKGHPNAIAYSGFHVPIDAHCYRQLANLPDHPWRQYPILVSFLDVAPVGMWVAKCNSCGYPLDIACSGVQQCPNIVTKHFTSDLIITIGIHRILMCFCDRSLIC